MDYQIVPKSHKHIMFVIISLLLIFSLLPHCLCIVNRDLVLTPKQGLQLSGKRIFYEESYNNDNNVAATNNLHHNDSVAEVGDLRPWERTLKHVTYLTLFTNAANGIITGNFSKVKEYNDFLSSAYVRSPNPLDSRFGDIVTLAQGRLETTTNGSYQFVEGNCDYECARDSNIIAMWHVQKIRHRDTADRKYHYEMKFSVSPLTAKAPTETVVRGGPNKRTIMEEQRNNVQTFIQKEDDYPLSFRKLVSDKDEDFTDRRYEAARNFRQVSQPHYQTQQVTPIPQSTFLRGVFHHPPHHASPAQMQLHNQHLQQHAQLQHHHPHHIQQQQLPLPERLNIGEFYKGNYIPKGPAKVDVFPNLLNMFMGKPQHHLPPPQPTTFRPPTYQMKFPRPEIYTLQQHQLQELPKFSEYHHPHPPPHLAQEQFTQRTPAAVPMVTHHYHHHYFMPNNSAITLEQIVHNQQSEEHNQAPSAEIYHNEVTEVATPQGYITNLYEETHATSTLKQPHFPQPQHQQQVHYHANIQRQNYNANQNVNYHFPQPVPPAPQKFVFPNTQIEQQRVIHVTPAPPLKKPQYQSQTQTQHQSQQHQQQYFENPPITSSLEYTTVHVPLLISYPAPISTEEERADVPTPRNKPFIQSDPMDEIVRYSEPDPLYAHINEAEIANEQKYLANEENSHHVANQEPQLESPQNYDQPRQNQKQTEDEPDNKREHSESIEAQLPAPNKNAQVKDEVKTVEEIKPKIPEQSTSQSTTTIKIADEKTTVKSIKTEASNSIISSTKRPKIFPLRNKRINFKSSTTTTAKPTTTSSTTTVAPKTSTTTKPQKSFVSTSTTESPLKTIGRYRNSYTRTSSTSTTTTEKPVLKWTPKRKFINNKFSPFKSTTTPAAKEIIKEESEDDETDHDDEDDDDIDNNETDNNDKEDIKTNESNNLVTSKITQSTTPIPTTTPELVAETTTQISNDITIGTTSTLSSLSSPSASSTPTTTSPLLTETSQDDTEIYEVLTQKSVSKSVSLKVGYNGEEIPVIVDDEENEVKKI